MQTPYLGYSNIHNYKHPTKDIVTFTNANTLPMRHNIIHKCKHPTNDTLTFTNTLTRIQ